MDKLEFLNTELLNFEDSINTSRRDIDQKSFSLFAFQSAVLTYLMSSKLLTSLSFFNISIVLLFTLGILCNIQNLIPRTFTAKGITPNYALRLLEDHKSKSFDDLKESFNNDRFYNLGVTTKEDLESLKQKSTNLKLSFYITISGILIISSRLFFHIFT